MPGIMRLLWTLRSAVTSPAVCPSRRSRITPLPLENYSENLWVLGSLLAAASVLRSPKRLRGDWYCGSRSVYSQASLLYLFEGFFAWPGLSCFYSHKSDDSRLAPGNELLGGFRVKSTEENHEGTMKTMLIPLAVKNSREKCLETLNSRSLLQVMVLLRERHTHILQATEAGTPLRTVVRPNPRRGRMPQYSDLPSTLSSLEEIEVVCTRL